jgi:hypothetical protein
VADRYKDSASRYKVHCFLILYIINLVQFLSWGNDLICVLSRCRIPVILRKFSNYYRFVGTCFVLGLMDGEAAQLLERGEADLQEFPLI